MTIPEAIACCASLVILLVAVVSFVASQGKKDHDEVQGWKC